MRRSLTSIRHQQSTPFTSFNAGVPPFHIVQRYLGHKSPEMTLRYAATLAATAEAEFLKHKKIGAHGADIAISAADLLRDDSTRLSAPIGSYPTGYAYCPH